MQKQIDTDRASEVLHKLKAVGNTMASADGLDQNDLNWLGLLISETAENGSKALGSSQEAE
ncbi:MAG: hypothetical protein A2W19_07320 [Spirochaetes bacterium RBG_16_49_21]|nr:MAG: hypothetical protein A2W19_07320 [Spirochaetes bacterium RBG_16_49_21]